MNRNTLTLPADRGGSDRRRAGMASAVVKKLADFNAAGALARHGKQWRTSRSSSSASRTCSFALKRANSARSGEGARSKPASLFPEDSFDFT